MFINFKKQVEAAGLTAKDCGNGHWQIVGGPLLVSYYPDTRHGSKVYVGGTTQGYSGTVEDAIRAATHAPTTNTLVKDPRRGSYRRVKMQMLGRYPFCNWCQKRLTRETATIDHVIPLDRGGLDNANNWTLACEPCNKERANNMPEVTGGK